MKKTWVQIYKDVDFIKQNYSRLFPSEIMDRIGISWTMLKRVAAELEVELLDISKCDDVIKRSRAAKFPKRTYQKRKKQSWFKTLISKL